MFVAGSAKLIVPPSKAGLNVNSLILVELKVAPESTVKACP